MTMVYFIYSRRHHPECLWNPPPPPKKLNFNLFQVIKNGVWLGQHTSEQSDIEVIVFCRLQYLFYLKM